MSAEKNELEELSEEEKREMDFILKTISGAIENDERGVSIADPQRMREFIKSETLLRRSLGGQGLKIEAIPHDDYASVGTIRVKAKTLIVREPTWFARAVSMASNYEVYPRTDGKIMLALTFYGMTKHLRGQ